MPSRIELKEGDYVDKEHNLLFIKEAGYDKHQRRKIGVYDIQYDEYFEASLNDIRRGHTKHSRQTSYMIRSRQQATWFPGEKKNIFGQPILFLVEVEPHYCIINKENNKKHRVRRGRFQNLNTLIVFEADISSVRSGSSSGTRKSKGERLIAEKLDNLQIDFIEQYVFVDCRSKNNRVLYFDFYLPDYNCCIEYDGEQHEVGWRGNLSSLEGIKERDNIKNEYCNSHNIHLIRISYKDFNNISEDFLQEKIDSIVNSTE